MIFDNADDVKLLNPYRPSNARGQILLTSRAQVFGSLGIAKPVMLKQMEPQEALEFLFKRTGKDSSNLAERDAVIELVEELERYPLALEQAGAYIQEEDCRIQDYLTIFRKDRLALLERYGPVTGNYPASVATTWNLNFKQVEEQSVVSADILRVSAFLSPDAIPYELFTLGASQLGDNISNALGNDNQNALAVNEHLTPLARYSLIRREPNTQTYSVYRLVQDVLKARMDEESYSLWVERSINAVTQAYPNADNYSNWQQCERFLIQAQQAIQLIDDLRLETEEVALLKIRTGFYLRAQGRYEEAEPLYRQALEMMKKLLGSEHPNTKTARNNLEICRENMSS